MLSLRSLVKVSIATIAMTSLPAFAGDANNAQNLSTALHNAKATVDRAIASVTGGATAGGSDGGSSGGAGGGSGSSPWYEDITESDALGLPILIQASSSLGNAASDADQAKLAFFGGNISFGNFRFSEACVQMGLSRSQIARANTAALQPPLGFLAAFGPDLFQLVVELNKLKVSEGCP